MSITYTVGDLIRSNETVIIHGCNSHGVQGSGVAKAIRDAYPDNYTTYRNEYEECVKNGLPGLPLGHIIPHFSDDSRIIINAITQRDFGPGDKKYVSYDAIHECFIKTNEFMHNNGLYRIGCPLIGAGLGGGDWRVIEEIIKSTLKNIEVVIYTLDGIVPGRNQ